MPDHRLHVLMYHEIVSRSDWPDAGGGPVRTAQGMNTVLPQELYVWQDQFEAQLAWLAQSGWTVVTPEAVKAFYAEARPLPAKAVLLTFDDLWKQGTSFAAGVLRRHGWRGLAFLVRSWLFDEPLTPVTGSPVCLAKTEWPALADVFAFANHTDRLHLAGPAGLGVNRATQDEFTADLRRCEQLTTLKGVFAYPFGAMGPGALAGLEAEGFACAFGTEPGLNTPATPRYQLHRQVVPRDLSLEGFAALFPQ